jgi:thiamine-monophosphate kinase
MTKPSTLQDLGERRIIEEVLRPRFGKERSEEFGNDCAIVGNADDWPSTTLVATTDPCPEPMSSFLGYKDLYYRGWLLATINLSDLAAAGARPLGLLTSLVLPNELSIVEFNRLLDGIDDCSRHCGTHVIGGNLKEGPKIDLTATAIGICTKGKGLTRRGCQPGDVICVIGDLGLFWAGVLASLRGVAMDIYEADLLKNILTPLPKVAVAQEIAEKQMLTACIDNSDGLYPSLAQLAEINKCQMLIDFEAIDFSPPVHYVSSKTSVSPVRFSLGWGDWQLVGCCSPEKVNALREIANRYSTDLFVIGKVRDGEGVLILDRGQPKPMTPIDSQRFSKDSWFTTGLESYIQMLIDNPLYLN